MAICVQQLYEKDIGILICLKRKTECPKCHGLCGVARPPGRLQKRSMTKPLSTLIQGQPRKDTAPSAHELMISNLLPDPKVGA